MRAATRSDQSSAVVNSPMEVGEPRISVISSSMRRFVISAWLSGSSSMIPSGDASITWRVIDASRAAARSAVTSRMRTSRPSGSPSSPRTRVARRANQRSMRGTRKMCVLGPADSSDSRTASQNASGSSMCSVSTSRMRCAVVTSLPMADGLADDGRDDLLEGRVEVRQLAVGVAEDDAVRRRAEDRGPQGRVPLDHLLRRPQRRLALLQRGRPCR